MNHLLARLAIPVLLAAAPLAVTPVKADAFSGCGGAQFLYEGRAWCKDLNQSINEWVRVGITCSATGSTIFYGQKIYLDGGSVRGRYSTQSCGLGMGTVSSVGTYVGTG